jgi:hypothetical protein
VLTVYSHIILWRIRRYLGMNVATQRSGTDLASPTKRLFRIYETKKSQWIVNQSVSCQHSGRTEIEERIEKRSKESCETRHQRVRTHCKRETVMTTIGVLNKPVNKSSGVVCNLASYIWRPAVAKHCTICFYFTIWLYDRYCYMYIHC